MFLRENEFWVLRNIGIYLPFPYSKGFQGFADGSAMKGDAGLIPGLGGSPGGGNGILLQYSCLENPMDKGAWWATVHGLQRVGHDWEANTHLIDTLERIDKRSEDYSKARIRKLGKKENEERKAKRLKTYSTSNNQQ